MKVEFYEQVFEKYIKFIKIGLIVAEFFYADRRTEGQPDTTKLILAFLIFANTSKNVANKSCRENQNTHFMYNALF
jgi:hypothetical protein